MKYFSTFTGIGGFELGIGEKHECVGYSEIDKHACAIYQHHFPTHKNYGDITKIDETTLPDFDLLVGGFPCQSFSIAGKRGGFNDKETDAKAREQIALSHPKGLVPPEAIANARKSKRGKDMLPLVEQRAIYARIKAQRANKEARARAYALAIKTVLVVMALCLFAIVLGGHR